MNEPKIQRAWTDDHVFYTLDSAFITRHWPTMDGAGRGVKMIYPHQRVSWSAGSGFATVEDLPPERTALEILVECEAHSGLKSIAYDAIVEAIAAIKEGRIQ